MVKLLTAINLIVAPIVWAPAWWRMYQRKSSMDYSIWTLLLVCFLQWSNYTIALINGNHVHELWFAVNGVMCLFTFGMVLWYRDARPEDSCNERIGEV